MTDTETLSIKLQEEIQHLERWLEDRTRLGHRPTSSPVTATIEELIRTRKKLLDSLQPQKHLG